MSAVTLPASVVSMFALENCSATASEAVPSANRPDSASASDSTVPSARTLTVRPPCTNAPSWTVVVDTVFALVIASAAAKELPLFCLALAPSTSPCSSRSVVADSFAVALASEVMLTAPPPCTTAWLMMSMVAVAPACE